MQWLNNPVYELEAEILDAAQAHQNQLTKPPGSLGRLEEIAVQFCAWQKTLTPKCESIAIRVFAADHGVCAQNISAFPQAVTGQMIENFIHGGAAISVLAKSLNADFKVINCGTVSPLELNSPRLEQHCIAAGTADFSTQHAMTKEQLEQALTIGRDQIDTLDSDLFIGGEMGIGNTTSASAIYAALLECPALKISGPGTGLDNAGISHKADIISKALVRHQLNSEDPIHILRAVGGFEIAALTGAYLRCAQRGIPALVDGFICSAAALLAIKMNPNVKHWLLFSHQSAEPGHRTALESLNVKPLLDLGLRLGEGSGAAIAAPLLISALKLHNSMASFADAGIATSDSQ